MRNLIVVFITGLWQNPEDDTIGFDELRNEIHSRFPKVYSFFTGYNKKDTQNVKNAIAQFDADIIIVGHSLGGERAVNLAKELETKVKHIFMLDPVAGSLGFVPSVFFRNYFFISNAIEADCYHRNPNFEAPYSRVIKNKSLNYRNHVKKIGHNDFARNNEIKNAIIKAIEAHYNAK